MAGLVAGSLALAAPHVPAAAQEVFDLGEIVVSAGRTPAPSGAIGRAHTVLDSQRIEELQIRYVSEALRHVPGVSVSQTGTTGGITQVRMRGSESNHVLVMIDGVEANELSQGEFDFGGLLAADIERIEVLRGPQSAFWGSNATAGVINIVTKSGRRGSSEARVTSEVGSDGTAMLNPSLRVGGERYDFAVSGAFRRNDGFNISDLGTEDDGHRNATVNAKTRIDLAHNLFLDASGRYVDRSADSDAQDFSGGPYQGLVIDTDDWTDTTESLGGIGLTWELLGGRFVQEARLKGSQIRRDNATDGARSSSNEGSRVEGTYQATFNFDTPELLDAHHRLTGGVEAKRETYRNLPPATPDQLEEQERRTTSFVAEYRVDLLDRLFLTGAVRHDDNDAFENTTTWSASAAYLLPTETRLHASVGTGITNPTFTEQFGYYPDSFIANPDLKPEESFGWDVGIERSFFDGRMTADITYFNATLRDEITTIYLPSGLSTAVNQSGKSPREGVEFAFTARPVEGLSVTAAYTYLSARNPDGSAEIRRPRHSGSVSAVYTFAEGRANVFADVVFNGRMQDDSYVNYFVDFSAERVILDDYVVVNVGGEYRVNDRLAVFGRVENLFDEEYENVFGYNTAGITGYAGLRMTLGSERL
ncbi:TonB-dependent receptor plug domain-containing protein [Lutibaculum baratangense]|uniref:TonB-dependent receptor n=1 Tax=Lutibaculum baratangense AMV1 TaxID=631454 RepID=V4RTP4_9HYPH|nr:TonB-dependent receptor [Lutibaculum baratangense]ESR26450.1 TonB-dependent receptor [Lutibaculum baratangense AMV1]